MLAWGPGAADAQRATQPLPIPTGSAAPGPGAGLDTDGPAGSGEGPEPPGSGEGPEPPGSRDDLEPSGSGGRPRPPGPEGDAAGRRARYLTIAVVPVVVMLLLAVPTMLLRAWAGPARPAGAAGHGVSVSAAAAGTVYLQAPPGLLIVTAVPGGQTRLTGQLHWSGRAPAVRVTAAQAGHVLRLSYRCAAASPCTGNLRLTVPGRTRLVLVLPAGRMVLSGLAGPVSITAANVSVRADGLRSPAFTAVIRSGQLSAGFAAPPRRVQATVVSAQATLRLPGGVGYAVSTQVSSGSVTVGVPRSAGSAYRLSARLDMAELRLLPA